MGLINFWWTSKIWHGRQRTGCEHEVAHNLFDRLRVGWEGYREGSVPQRQQVNLSTDSHPSEASLGGSYFFYRVIFITCCWTDKIRDWRQRTGCETLYTYLTECIYRLVLESQLLHEIVNLLFPIANENTRNLWLNRQDPGRENPRSNATMKRLQNVYRKHSKST